MAEKRITRDTESRKASIRSSDAWTRPGDLPMPDDRPGWNHRYIRISSLGKEDTRNLSRRLREGWEPVNAAEYKELKTKSDIDSRYPDSIEIGGLLLCRIPTEIVEKRNEHFANVNNNQMKSVNQGFLNENDPRMPKYDESRSEVSRTHFRKG